MGRRKRGQPIHGWIILDKPLNISSAQAVARVQRSLDAAKAGHGGTLDPLATGILPIALGEATKTVSYVMDGAKSYRWSVRWGESRSTDDAEGEVTGLCDKRPSEQEIRAALPSFIGAISQIPPIFSAVKIAGKRAYELARKDEAPVLAPRLVQIDDFRLVGMTEDEAIFETDCGKGTYIRSLARDLARFLGGLGYVASLRRTRCGPFREENAICLDMLEGIGHTPDPLTKVLPVETALDDIPALALTEDEARRLQSGQHLPVSQLAASEFQNDYPQGQTLRAMNGGRLAALARIEGAILRPVRVLNL